MRLKSLWPFFLWMALIIVLSTTSGKSFPSSDWMQWFKLDKWIHAFLYFVLFLLLYIPVRNGKTRWDVKSWTVYILSPALGAGLELIQTLIPDRSGDLPDAVANTVGVLIAVFLLRWKLKKWPWEDTVEGTVVSSDGTA